MLVRTDGVTLNTGHNSMGWVGSICSDLQNPVLCWSDLISTHILENLEKESYCLQLIILQCPFSLVDLSWLFGSTDRHIYSRNKALYSKRIPALSFKGIQVDWLLLQIEQPKDIGLGAYPGLWMRWRCTLIKKFTLVNCFEQSEHIDQW